MLYKTVDDIFNSEIVSDRYICAFIGIVSFLILTILGAFVRFRLPFTPVPFTFQTFFVLFASAAMGPRLSLITQSGYLMLGYAGLPVFAAGIGSVVLLGPTGGYIMGFLLASYIIGNAMKGDRKKSLLNIYTWFLIGTIGILISGALWLKAFIGFSLRDSVTAGILPFIPGDIVKMLAAGFLYHCYQERFRSIFPR